MSKSNGVRYPKATKKLILKKRIATLMRQFSLFFGSGEYAKSARVLTYHSTPDGFEGSDTYQMSTPKDIFSEQMQFLYENKYNVVSCEKLVEEITSGRCIEPMTVAITFDDGFKNNLTNAFPILERYKFKATMFLATDFIGLSAEQLSWDDISYLSKTDVFSFGAHSVTHRKLIGLDKLELEKEIGMPKMILEQILKSPIDLFAYPFGCYGSFDRNSIDILKSKGYKAAFTTIAGYNTINTDPYLLKRTRISWFDDRKEFAKEMVGAYDWYALWQRLTGTP